MLGRFPNLKTKCLPAPPPPSNVVMLLYLCTVRGMIPVAIKIAWGRGWGFRNDGTAKLMATGYRYPEYKCTRTTLFWCLCQNYWPGLYITFPKTEKKTNLFRVDILGSLIVCPWIDHIINVEIIMKYFALPWLQCQLLQFFSTCMSTIIKESSNCL